MIESTKAIFLSYASQDAEVARRLCDALRAAGLEVWFDQSELRGGDAWDASIRQQIRECALFVPLISANTNARSEGYFRREWNLAVHRMLDMADDQTFLLPVLIDDTVEPLARVPDRFRERQWTRLHAGEALATFVELVSGLLSPDARTSPTPLRPQAGIAPLPDTLRSGAGPATAPASGQPSASWRSRPALLVITAAVVLAAVYVVADKLALPNRVAEVETTPPVPAGKATQPAVSDKSIAVLPFVNLSGDDNDSYLGDGISGEILSALSKLPGLRVIGRASSFQFRGPDVDAAKVGHELNVSSLLSGTVQRAGEDLRITVELIETATGVQLWSQHYDRKFKNLFALEDDISGAVSKALAVRLGATAGQPLVNVATTNPHAHDLYLRAKELSFRSDEASLDQAVALFNQAIAEDPNYAAAWAGLAGVYAFLADAYRAPIELLPAMKGAAEKAVALDPNLAEAHAYLGYILLCYQRDFPAARHEATRAVEINPGSADARFFLGLYWLLAKDPASARAEFQIAGKLDPLNPWPSFSEMWTATAEGDYAVALKAATRVLELDPGFSYFTDPLAYVYGSFGRWQDCIDRSAARPTGAGGKPDYKIAVCHAHSGDTERARKILAQLESASLNRYTDHVNIAEIYVALGDKTGAFAALDQAYRDRSAPLLNLWFLPELKPLHEDSRYRALTDRVYASLNQGAKP